MIAIALVWASALLVLARVSHAAVRQREVRAQRAHRTFSDDGIVAGANGFQLQGARGRGVLLLHGSGDTPQSLRYLAERLHAAGFTVHVPRLPGHGRTVDAFAHVSRDAYMQRARLALDALLLETGRVTIGGLSMGAALAAAVAADHPEVSALVLLAPYLTVPRSIWWVACTSRIWGVAVPFIAGRGDRSIHDPVEAAGGLAYGVFSPAALRALVAVARAARAALPRVTVPTLVIHSRDDNRIPARFAETSTTSLRAPTERHWVAGCGHVITADYCKDRVAELVLDFVERHGA